MVSKSKITVRTRKVRGVCIHAIEIRRVLDERYLFGGKCWEPVLKDLPHV